MSSWIDLSMAGIVLLNLALVSSSRISLSIKIVAFQGILAGLLPMTIRAHPFWTDMMVFSFASVFFKGFVFPWFLSRAQRQANVWRDEEPWGGYPLVMAIGLLSFVMSTWLSRQLPLPYPMLSSWIVPVAFSTMLTGFLVIITRGKAIMQVLGYVAIENGIYIFGLALLLEQPLLVELAILLDIFVAVFVMGITIFHISREFDHIDTQYLSQLGDAQSNKQDQMK